MCPRDGLASFSLPVFFRQDPTRTEIFLSDRFEGRSSASGGFEFLEIDRSCFFPFLDCRTEFPGIRFSAFPQPPAIPRFEASPPSPGLFPSSGVSSGSFGAPVWLSWSGMVEPAPFFTVRQRGFPACPFFFSFPSSCVLIGCSHPAAVKFPPYFREARPFSPPPQEGWPCALQA